MGFWSENRPSWWRSIAVFWLAPVPSSVSNGGGLYLLACVCVYIYNHLFTKILIRYIFLFFWQKKIQKKQFLFLWQKQNCLSVFLVFCIKKNNNFLKSPIPKKCIFNVKLSLFLVCIKILCSTGDFFFWAHSLSHDNNANDLRIAVHNVVLNEFSTKYQSKTTAEFQRHYTVHLLHMYFPFRFCFYICALNKIW